MRRPEIERLLPSVYQLALNPIQGWVLEPDRPLGAVLDAMEALHDPIEQILDTLEQWIDPRRAPDSFVPYLSGWVDLDRLASSESTAPQQAAAGAARGSDPTVARAAAAAVAASMPVSGMSRLRELVAAASELARWRGTNRGLLAFLHIATGYAGFSVDEEPRTTQGQPRPFHVVVHGPEEAASVRPLIERIVESEKPAYVTADVVLGEQQQPGSS
jgi:hypothetical protein